MPAPTRRTRQTAAIAAGALVLALAGPVALSAMALERTFGPNDTLPTNPTGDPTPRSTTRTPTRPFPTPTPSPTDVSAAGLPDGIDRADLTVHLGDLIVTTPGQVIDQMDVRGFIIVRAANVTVKNSYIAGRVSDDAVRGLITATHQGSSVTVTNSILRADQAHWNVEGLRGGNITADQVVIANVIDGAHLWLSNTSITNSVLRDNAHFDQDPNWGGQPSHDDSIQIVGGSNYVIAGNNITGSYSAGIQLTQTQSPVSDVTIASNYLNGGSCTINFAEKGQGPFYGVSLTDNTFGRDTRTANCAVIAPTTTRDLLTHSGNVFTDGTPITIRNGG